MANIAYNNIPRPVLQALTEALGGNPELEHMPHAYSLVMTILKAWPDAWLGNDPDAAPTMCLPFEGEITNG